MSLDIKENFMRQKHSALLDLFRLSENARVITNADNSTHLSLNARAIYIYTDIKL